MPLSPIKTFVSKKEAVYDALRTAILQGDLPPGERLIIDALARNLGVSAIPIREALQLLQADGLVDIKPHSGATVTEIKTNTLYEVFKLLEATEIISSRAACEHMSNNDLQELELLIREMDALVTKPDAWSRENVRLHRFICERSGTRLAGDVMIKTLDQWDRIRRYYLDAVFASRVARAQAQHWEIFRALKARDAVQVEVLIQMHNQTALADYQALLDEEAAGSPE